MKNQYKTLSLFSGAMGLDIGLMQAGVNVCLAQELDKHCIATIKKNGHPVLEGDITKILKNDPDCSNWLRIAGITKKELFAVVGGPPCQAFSTAGKRKGISDIRGTLYESFIEVIEKTRPRFFVMENVKGLLSINIDNTKKSSLLIDIILAKFASLDYAVSYGVLNSANYGTPQLRERVVLIGSRDKEKIFLPEPTHYKKHQDKNMRWNTVGNSISSLSEAEQQFLEFTPKIKSYLAHVPEGGNWKDLPINLQQKALGGAFTSGGGKSGFYRRLSFSSLSPTLLTSPVQKSTLLCHPTKLRPLSIQEYARIQQFPDSWIIEGSLSNKYKQVGNAVPVGLGKAIGDMLISVSENTSEIFTRKKKF